MPQPAPKRSRPTLAESGIPLRKRGRPSKAATGSVGRKITQSKDLAPLIPPARITEFALHDRGIAMLPVFRPVRTDNDPTDLASWLASTRQGTDLKGYAVRMPVLSDKRLGCDIELAVVCPTPVGAAEEDLLVVLHSIGVQGARRERGKRLDVTGSLLDPGSAAYVRAREAFEPEDAGITTEYLTGSRDETVIGGPLYRIRCSRTTLVREWRNRDDGDAPLQLMRSLQRLAAISYFARRVGYGVNTSDAWGGMRLLRFKFTEGASDGRDLTIWFSERLTQAMLGFVGPDGSRDRNGHVRLNLEERFALPRGTPRLLHRYVSVTCWEREEGKKRGRPSKRKPQQVTATRDYTIDHLVEALWGPCDPTRDKGDRRDKRKPVVDALVEIGRLPGWAIREDPIKKTIVVTRKVGVDEVDGEQGTLDLLKPAASLTLAENSLP